MPAMPEHVQHVIADATRICTTAAPTFAEERRAELVRGLLSNAGPGAELDAAGNVICRFGPKDGPATIFAAHLDTVFPAEQAIDLVHDEAAGRIHAPGIGDNSLGVAALVHLARILHTDGVRHPILLAATVGEEGLGDLRGAKALLESTPCTAFVAVEGSMIDSIKTAGVGSVRFRVTYRGPGGHSWSDRGAPSAVHGLIEAAARFLASPLPTGLARNVGKLAGGTSINTIAAEATLELDLRAEDQASLAQAEAATREAFENPPAGLEATVELIGRRPSGAIDHGHPLLAAARRARHAAGLPPAAEGASSTDANAAYGLSIPAITIGLTTGANAHRLDEYIDLEPLERGLAALEHLAHELAQL
jgi:acetylornithine deacetylase/succinyl-diaminopimelate desuccinylase-like protein